MNEEEEKQLKQKSSSSKGDAARGCGEKGLLLSSAQRYGAGETTAVKFQVSGNKD